MVQLSLILIVQHFRGVKVGTTHNTNEKHKHKKLFLLMFVLVLLGLSVNLWAGDLKVEEKIVLNALPKAVWALVGGFKALDRWHPDVAESALIGTGKQAGDIRILTLNNSETIVEILDSYDEGAMVLQYRILESPLPVENYAASISVKSKDGDLAEVIWQSSFNAVNVSDDEVKQIISGIYLTGLDSLNSLFAK